MNGSAIAVGMIAWAAPPGSLEFQVINGDYAGDAILALACLYRDKLAEGL